MKQTHAVNGEPAVELSKYPGVFVLKDGYVGTGVSLTAHGCVIEPAKGDDIEVDEKQLAQAEKYFENLKWASS